MWILTFCLKTKDMLTPNFTLLRNIINHTNTNRINKKHFTWYTLIAHILANINRLKFISNLIWYKHPCGIFLFVSITWIKIAGRNYPFSPFRQVHGKVLEKTVFLFGRGRPMYRWFVLRAPVNLSITIMRKNLAPRGLHYQHDPLTHIHKLDIFVRSHIYLWHVCKGKYLQQGEFNFKISVLICRFSNSGDPSVRNWEPKTFSEGNSVRGEGLEERNVPAGYMAPMGKSTSGAPINISHNPGLSSQNVCIWQNDLFTFLHKYTIWKQAARRKYTFTQSQINPLSDWEVVQKECVCVCLIFQSEACRNQSPM